MAPHRTYSVEFARIAEQDIASIVDYIALDDPSATHHVLDQIENAATRLERFPERGRIVPELEAIGLVTHRELIIAPWRLLYRIHAKTIYVVAVFDGRRNLEEVLLDRVVRTSDLM
jgi:plasmid stabilization system protein ParE